MLRPARRAFRLVGSDGSVVRSPPVMRARAMLRSIFRVRNAKIIAINGGTMLYHGAVCVSAVWCGADRAARVQIAAKMTAEAAVLESMRIFVFTSSV